MKFFKRRIKKLKIKNEKLQVELTELMQKLEEKKIWIHDDRLGWFEYIPSKKSGY